MPVEPNAPALGERRKRLLGEFESLASCVQRLAERVNLQLGSLGGGNQFIEICVDNEQAVWVMLHSGSRHIGAALAEHHMETAEKTPSQSPKACKNIERVMDQQSDLVEIEHELKQALCVKG